MKNFDWDFVLFIFRNEFSSAFCRFITFYEMKVDGWTWILCSIKQVHLLNNKKLVHWSLIVTTTTISLFTCSRFVCFSLRCLNRETHSRPHSISMQVLFLSNWNWIWAFLFRFKILWLSNTFNCWHCLSIRNSNSFILTIDTHTHWARSISLDYTCSLVFSNVWNWTLNNNNKNNYVE